MSQPGINYTGCFSMAAGGCNVDDSSKLLIGGIQTNPKARIDLFGRPFATVPYLGRGSVDPMLEAQIQQGESVTNRRTITHLPERNQMAYRTIPLIPEVKSRIQNPQFMIESLADETWVRGGLSSRDEHKDRQQYQ